MRKVYLVQTMDIWSNITFMGIYSDLKVAEKEIVEEYKDLFDVTEFKLVEYASTFGTAFDTELHDEESGEFIRVFGYIFQVESDADKLNLEIKGGYNE